VVLNHAQAICASDSEEDAWDYIQANRESFFWTDDEQHVETLNRMRGIAVQDQWQADELRYIYRGKSARVPLRQNRDDLLLFIHALGLLVREECEFRLCRDSLHSSDHAFLAMPPADWAALESSVERSGVDAHFVPLDPDFDVFLENATPPPSPPQSAPRSPPPNRNYILVCDGPGQLRHAELERLIRRYLEPGPVEVTREQQTETRWVDRGALIKAIARDVGSLQIRIANRARTGFLVIELNGAAVGWRTDGNKKGFEDQPDLAPPARWWEFWKRP
jgi:hypothetical protein